MNLGDCLGAIIASYVAPTDHSDLIKEIQAYKENNTYLYMRIDAEWGSHHYKILSIRDDSIVVVSYYDHFEGIFPEIRVIKLDNFRLYFIKTAKNSNLDTIFDSMYVEFYKAEDYQICQHCDEYNRECDCGYNDPLEFDIRLRSPNVTPPKQE